MPEKNLLSHTFKASTDLLSKLTLPGGFQYRRKDLLPSGNYRVTVTARCRQEDYAKFFFRMKRLIQQIEGAQASMEE